MKLTHVIATVMLCAIALGTVSAAELDTSKVAADAAWVAHLDAERMRKTELGSYFNGEMQKEEAAAGFEALKAIFKFDVRTDLKSLTLYGKGKGREEGVALLSADFDTEHLVTLVKANEHYSTEIHGVRTIHTWIDEKKPGIRTYGCVMADDLIVIGDGKQLVKDAIDVIDGNASDMSGMKGLPGLTNAAESAFFVASADMSQMPEIHPKAAVLKQNNAGSVSFAEEDGRFKGTVSLLAKDAESAMAVHSIVQGLIGLARLNENQDQRLLAMLTAMKLDVSGNEVSVSLDYPVADVISFIREKKQTKAPASAF